jgi:hypothetical protein
MIVWRIAAGGRVLRRRKTCAVCARERSEIIVEAVVLLNNDYDMLDWIVRLHALSQVFPTAPMQSSIWLGLWDARLPWTGEAARPSTIGVCRAGDTPYITSSRAQRPQGLRSNDVDRIDDDAKTRLAPDTLLPNRRTTHQIDRREMQWEN